MRNWKSVLIAHPFFRFAILITLPIVFSVVFVTSSAAEEEQVLVQGRRADSQDLEAIGPPFAPTIIDSSQIQLKGASTLGEILRNQSGLEILNSGGPGQVTSLSIRGANADHVLVLVDGIRANNAINPNASFDFSDLALSNIERIEIYKGAETIRFGPDAIGGVINILTKMGSGPLHAMALIEAGSYVTHREVAEASGSRGAFSYSFGGSILNTQGFSAADERLGNTERDGATLGSLSSQLSLDLQSLGELHLTMRTNDNRVDLDANGGPHGDDPNYTSRFQQTMTGVSWKNHSLTSSFQSELLISDSRVEASDRNPPDFSSSTDAADHFRTETMEVSNHNTWTVTDATKALFNVNYLHIQGSSRSIYNGSASTLSAIASQGLGESALLQYDKDLWIAELGLRHDEFNANLSSWNESGSIGLRSPDKNSELVGRAFTGLKVPTLYQLYSVFGNPELRTESVQGWEMKGLHRFENRIQLTVSTFDNLYKNLIDFEPSINKYQNTQASRISGLELESTLPVSDPLLVVHTYWTHLMPIDSRTGLDLLRRPRDQIGAEIQSDLGNMKISLGYLRLGDRSDVDPVSFQRATLPAYDIWNLNSSIDVAKDYQLKLRWLNILDRHYEDISGYGTSGAALYVGLQGNFH